jgi:hypothetical protein
VVRASDAASSESATLAAACSFDLLLELVVGGVELLEDLRHVVRVDRAGAVALLDAVDGLLPRQLDRLVGAGLERAQALLEVGERALRLRALEPRLEDGERLPCLRGECVDLLRGAVLGLQVAVLDVEVPDDQVAAGEEVLSHGHELLEPGDVALGELLGVAGDLAETAEADDGGDDEGEDEESERGAQPRGQTQVQEGLHGPGHRPLDARLKRSRTRDHFQRTSSSPQSAMPATRCPSGPV